MRLFVAMGLILTPTLACRSPEEWREDADKQVYEILTQRRAQLGLDEGSFTIEPPPDSLRQRLLRGEELGPLDLVDCLEIAAENNREYQDRRERLYLAALDLTLERYRFEFQPSVGASAAIGGQGKDATASVGASAGFTRLLGNGTEIMLDIGERLLRNLATGDGWDAITDLGLTITQPLLAGSSRLVVEEPLTQAERDVVYEVRAYERFRRTFAVDVAERLYRLLQQGDTVANEQANVANLTALRERNEAFGEAGRLSDYEVDQARQDELGSKNQLIIEVQRYEAALDLFKLFLGLPISTPLELDPAELERLAQDELKGFELEWENLAERALVNRLDFQTQLDQVEDSWRRVLVAQDSLRAILDLRVATLASSDEGQPLEIPGENVNWLVSLDLDLPIDRLPERNVYRAALIAHQASQRGAEEFADQIRVDVREDLRESATALETYRIQRSAVTLAERRVESTSLNLDAGRSTTRDLLEAQEDLVDAQNAATQALIDYHVVRLALYLDLELLTVEDSGIALLTESLNAPEEDA